MVQSYKKNLTYASRSQEKFHFSPFISKSVCQRSFALIRVGHNFYILFVLSVPTSFFVSGHTHKKAVTRLIVDYRFVQIKNNYSIVLIDIRARSLLRYPIQ